MAKLVWDQIGSRLYETGTDRGVLFPVTTTGAYGEGVAWSGLTKVTESPDGGEETALYADNIKYLSMYSIENYKGTIEAYTYPDEFEACDGSTAPVPGVNVGQQTRRPFGLAYRTRIGNDVNGTAHGYKIHLVYGLRVSPSERAYETINDTPGAVTFSWSFSSTPVDMGNDLEVSSTITINSLNVPEAKLKELEDILYGTDAVKAKFPTPAEVFALFTVAGGTRMVTTPNVSNPESGK